MHRPPTGPRASDRDTFDLFLREQRQRMQRFLASLSARRARVLSEVLGSTGYHWEPSRGNVTGSPGRGHYPRNGS